MHESSPTGSTATVSIGFAHTNRSETNTKTLFAYAGEALYQAKHIGRNRGVMLQGFVHTAAA